MPDPSSPVPFPVFLPQAFPGSSLHLCSTHPQLTAALGVTCTIAPFPRMASKQGQSSQRGLSLSPQGRKPLQMCVLGKRKWHSRLVSPAKPPWGACLPPSGRQGFSSASHLGWRVSTCRFQDLKETEGVSHAGSRGPAPLTFPQHNNTPTPAYWMYVPHILH